MKTAGWAVGPRAGNGFSVVGKGADMAAVDVFRQKRRPGRGGAEWMRFETSVRKTGSPGKGTEVDGGTVEP